MYPMYSKLLPFIVALLFALTVTGQRKEFRERANGLIYGQETMAQLSYIVDSLNTRFESCSDAPPRYLAKQQTLGYLVRLESDNLAAVLRDLERGMPFDQFEIKYPKATIEKDQLFVKWKYTNYHNEMMAKVKHFDLSSDYGYEIQLTSVAAYDERFRGKWLYHRYDNTKDYGKRLTAFYFPHEFESAPLPPRLASAISYADCMVDTTVTKFKEGANTGWAEDLPRNWRRRSKHKQEALLEEMRSTKVVGFCSMDDSPRIHAMNIALLSAETANWGVFLKSHLDIMNDRFERMSDGSYAQASRKTYIRELEQLDIDVLALITGISLRIENPSTNHYYGSISRLGRALSETTDHQALEKWLLSIIADANVDDHNRLIFYFLYKNYLYYLDSEQKEQNEQKLGHAIRQLPDYYKMQLTASVE